MSSERVTIDTDNLIRRYKAGESVKQLASDYGVSRDTVNRRLRKSEVEIRDRSASMYNRMAQTSPEERARLSAAAHDAVRGMTRVVEDLESRAYTKQIRLSHATDEEIALGREIQQRGLSVTPQQAVGKYNIDLGVGGTVAVEVFGGSWHRDGRHMARMPQRLVDLADRGFNTLMVWSAREWLLDVALVADEVVAFHKLTSSDPAFRRQYRMVWGDGELATGGSVDDDDLALKPTRVGSRNARRR